MSARETEINMQLDFSAFVHSLSIMLYGMGGIFIVIAVIVLCVWGLNRLFPAKEQ